MLNQLKKRKKADRPPIYTGNSRTTDWRKRTNEIKKAQGCKSLKSFFILVPVRSFHSIVTMSYADDASDPMQKKRAHEEVTSSDDSEAEPEDNVLPFEESVERCAQELESMLEESDVDILDVNVCASSQLIYTYL